LTHKERFYPESRFGGFTDIDGTIAFYMRVWALLDPASTVLDVGCGRGAYDEDPVGVRRNLRIFKGKVARVIGIDVDPAGATHPFLDEFRLLKDGEWPLPESSVDTAIADCVLEHVADPASFFRNAHRVLRPGGALCLRTPNAWSYIALAARLVPSRYHAAVTARVQERRKTEDVFPTLYRCNSVPKLRRALAECGFDGVAYGYEAEPSYLEFSRIAYGMGVLHQRLAPSFLRPVLHAFARARKDSAGGSESRTRSGR
jgi:SAM-dependent methyltransferase